MIRAITIIFAFVTTASAEPMQFIIAPNTPESKLVRIVAHGGQYEIFASGEIDQTTPDRFSEFVKKNKIDDAIVLFNSPGGSLSAGIALGKMIRSMEFDTGIGSRGKDGARLFEGTCASSCAYAFAGGRYRFFGGEKQKLGIHQFYARGENKADMGETQLVSSLIVDYLQSMDVDPQAFVAASTTPGESMFWLTPEQAKGLYLSNDGADPTLVELKMLGSAPYLKLEQTRFNVTTRILLACENKRISLAAGIVTTPELSTLKKSGLTRTYLESDFGELLIEQGDSRTSVYEAVLWLERTPTPADWSGLMRTKTLGVWTENGGPMRWGAVIDLRPAKEKLSYFARNCTSDG